MIYISHRGNINGRVENSENNPDYIDNTISMGYNVEIDIWFFNDELWLGHDEPQYAISQKWLEERCDKLWVHCKNLEAIEYFSNDENGVGIDINYFWHQTDDVTLTSFGYIWAYPGKQPIKNSIAVLPEINNDDIKNCIGICSDYIYNYK